MDIPQKSNITYDKIQKLKGSGLQLVAHWQIEKDDGVYVAEFNMKRTEPIHQDLEDRFLRLKKMMLMCSGYAKLPKTEYTKMLNSISITGISLSGEGESEGAILTGVRRTRTGKELKISSERIIFSADDYAFEQDLRETCVCLCDEAFSYMFENKIGVLTIL